MTISYSHHHHLFLLLFSPQIPHHHHIMSPSPSPPSSAARAAAAPASPPSTGDPPSSLAIALATVAAAASPAPNPNPNNPNSCSTTSNSAAARRGLPPPCWTNEETLALIDSYREKWYSLRRGNLRAAHWDEVSAAVARRSLHLPSSTPKTSVQCRHKIEKLRKRYRSERQRSLNHDPTAPPSSPWIFFHKMDQMENPDPNPTPIAIHNPNHNTRSHQNHYPRYQESDDDDEEEEEIEPQFHRRPQIVANGGGLKFTIPKAVRTSRAMPIGNPSPNPGSFNAPSFSKGFVKPGMEEMRRRLEAKRRRGEEEVEEEEDKDSGAMGEMVRALRMLGDGYMRMEQMKMETAREMERARMEMELKRTEMILDTQRRIVDLFVKGVVGEKKMKRSPDS